MSSDKAVAFGMEQRRKAVGVLKSDEVGFAWMEVEVSDFEHLDLLLGHLRSF
jgi:hypothetical protein